MVQLRRGALGVGIFAACCDAFIVGKQQRKHTPRTAPISAVEFADPLVLGGGAAAVLGLSALTLGKPSDSEAVDDIKEVREYFNTVGFERWNKIYSESDEVNNVQMDIRDGHQQTIDTVLSWVDEKDNGVEGKSVCDLGCGVGSLAIPLAQRGATVSASDISAAMATEAQSRAEAMGVKTASFEANNLESVEGSYDTVTCIDVMIHYPTDKMKDMVQHLASLSSDRLLISFAPKTTQYVILKKIGSLFPGPSKTTRAYLHPESSVREALADAGFTVKRSKLTATSFYFSTLLEATRSA
mmetsp:Transcript_48902/g.66650  ORF Transcript_48902/g.66650 Transcript_48902/m.66650 type:complete len:298 (-) Transcript_48902:289-1182(-)|eukprot:CAMPEP_0185767310 /NCGR_PEP_ID=MMETSP1174-20130828/41996_1 /TAXON_ID=35687 /ORGANISM="Dictyocha speculum, Strain CCMP1381" /LENGTH=297 /DNA_ID=CAMNT_0028451413 /DNA_START=30 /DNA_END=923 /DNA_ORIENTATION=+